VANSKIPVSHPPSWPAKQAIQKAIEEKLTHLRVLDVSGTTISDQEVIAILEECKKIKALNLSLCEVTDTLLESGIFKRCKELKILNMDYCSRF
jgi:hypothetical protein